MTISVFITEREARSLAEHLSEFGVIRFAANPGIQYHLAQYLVSVDHDKDKATLDLVLERVSEGRSMAVAWRRGLGVWSTHTPPTARYNMDEVAEWLTSESGSYRHYLGTLVRSLLEEIGQEDEIMDRSTS